MELRASAPCQAGWLRGCDDLGTLGEVPERVSGWPRAGVLASDFPSFSLRPADSSAAPCVEQCWSLESSVGREECVTPRAPTQGTLRVLVISSGTSRPGGALAPRHRWLHGVRLCGAGADSTWVNHLHHLLSIPKLVGSKMPPKGKVGAQIILGTGSRQLFVNDQLR